MVTIKENPITHPIKKQKTKQNIKANIYVSVSWKAHEILTNRREGCSELYVKIIIIKEKENNKIAMEFIADAFFFLVQF
jgi:hypothetical protein